MEVVGAIFIVLVVTDGHSDNGSGRVEELLIINIYTVCNVVDMDPGDIISDNIALIVNIIMKLQGFDRF